MADSNTKYLFAFLLPIGLGIFCLASLVGCGDNSSTASGTAGTAETGSTESSSSADVAFSTTLAVANNPTDWKQFRGPNMTSTAFSTGLPTEWDENNVVWKSELIGRGCSTPIIVGDRVFVTSYSGYGESAKKPGSLRKLRHHLYCFDRPTGELVWQRDLSLIHI